MSKPTETPTTLTTQTTADEGEVSTEEVLEALRDVVDPELGINVVDLGLVYGVNLDPAGEGSSRSRRST